MRYLFGPGVVTGAVMPVILARTSSGGTTAWYLTDNLGSVRDIVNTSGTVIDHIVYDSFGNIVTETNATNGDRFKFAGMEWDAAIGVYYDRARYYDPTTGRFVSQDPKGFAAGDTNLYRYVGNDPTNTIDPSGLQEMPVTGPFPAARLGPEMTNAQYAYALAMQKMLAQAMQEMVQQENAMLKATKYKVWLTDPISLINKGTIQNNMLDNFDTRRDHGITRYLGKGKFITYLENVFFLRSMNDQMTTMLHESFHYTHWSHARNKLDGDLAEQFGTEMVQNVTKTNAYMNFIFSLSVPY